MWNCITVLTVLATLSLVPAVAADEAGHTEPILLMLVAGEEPPVSEEDTRTFIDKVGDFLFHTPTSAETGGRGLLTTQGPSGTYLNPTSATLPQNNLTFQYCTVYPNNSTSVVQAHGVMASFGVTDWLEVGVVASLFDFKGQPDRWGVGPLVRVRLMEQDEFWPQISVGAYSRFGDVEDHTIFVAAYRRFEIDPDGFLRAIGLHGGLRETWVGHDADRSGAPVAYVAVEIELPFYFSIFAEVSTRDPDAGGTSVPYGIGIQWRYGVINVSLSVLNTGAFNEPSFFWGVGPQWSF